MLESMIKISEFAKRFGVSDRHARRLAADNEKELSGHIVKKGSGGTWIDEYAADYLRRKLRNPIEILPTPTEEEVDPAAMEKRIETLQGELLDAYKLLADERSIRLSLTEELGQQRLLAAQTDAEKERADRAEERQLDAEQRARAAEEAAKTAEDIAQIAAQEAEQAKAEAAELQKKLDGLKKRGLLARILNREV
jgi:translation initiation factor IF-2